MKTETKCRNRWRNLSFLAIALAVPAAFVSGIPSVSAATCSYPGQVIDLGNWKETLPIGSSGSPTEIKQTALNSFVHDTYFRANALCDGVIFRAPVNGVTTSGSGYPRSELREMTGNGKNLASWSTTSGTHTMIIDQAITAVPKSKKHVVAGQIHDSEDDVIVIRLEYPKLFVDINGKDGPVLDPNYTLGKRFNVKFVASGGKINVYYNGGDKPVYTLSKSGSGNYFKAGAYTQSNCSKESVCDGSNYGEVMIHNLLVQHQDGTVASTVALPTPAPTPEPTPAPETMTPVPSTTSTTSTSSGQASSGQAPSTSPSVMSSGSNDSGQASSGSNDSEQDPVTASITGVSFEAESGILSGLMRMLVDKLALGEKYIVQTGNKKKGTAKYTVEIPQSGQYQVRARVITPDGSSNSISYAVDSTKKFKTWHFPKFSDWTWTDGPVVNLSAGTHTFIMKKREPNTRLDTFEFRLR